MTITMRYLPVTEPGDWGPALTPSAQLAEPVTPARASANTDALGSMVGYADENGLDLWWPDGVWDYEPGIVHRSRVNHAGPGSSRTFVRSAPQSVDDLTPAWTWGDDSTDYTGAQTAFSGLTLIGNGATGPNPQAPTSTGPEKAPVLRPGLVIDGVTGARLQDVSVRGYGIGLLAKNNCGGLVLDNVWSKYAVCHVPVQCLGDSGSGSDWLLLNCWLTGVYCGVAVAPNCTDFWLVGGQIAANHDNRLQLSAESDVAGLWLGRDATTGIGADGLPGEVPPSGASLGLVTATGVDFEGTRFGWVVARGWGSSYLTARNCNLIAYPTGGTFTAGPTSGGCSGLLRVSDGRQGQWSLHECQAKGSYLDSDRLVVAEGLTTGGQYTETDLIGKAPTCFGAGARKGNQLPADWLKRTWGAAGFSNLAARVAQDSGGYRAVSGDYTDHARGGRRVLTRIATSGIPGLEQSTDGGVNWVKL